MNSSGKIFNLTFGFFIYRTFLPFLSFIAILSLYDEIKNDTLFKKEYEEKWICSECGYIFEGIEVPDYCPNCYHPKGYFKLLCEKY